jgi:hypothetical protein
MALVAFQKTEKTFGSTKVIHGIGFEIRGAACGVIRIERKGYLC